MSHDDRLDPEPSSGAIHLFGPRLGGYDLMVALGVLAGMWLARRRGAVRGGDPDESAIVFSIAVVVVLSSVAAQAAPLRCQRP